MLKNTDLLKHLSRPTGTLNNFSEDISTEDEAAILVQKFQDSQKIGALYDLAYNEMINGEKSNLNPTLFKDVISYMEGRDSIASNIGDIIAEFIEDNQGMTATPEPKS